MGKKVYVIIIFIIFAILSGVPISQATSEVEIEPVLEVAINPDDWDPSSRVDETINSTLADKAGKILGFIRNVGIVTSVIALMIIGLKTMFGSIEEKSKYKESLPGYLIGVFLLFATTTIPSIIYNFFK